MRPRSTRSCNKGPFPRPSLRNHDLLDIFLNGVGLIGLDPGVVIIPQRAASLTWGAARQPASSVSVLHPRFPCLAQTPR